MENKPNNEISELLARLQQNVEKTSEPQTDAKKNTSEQSAGELLSLLKKNIGAVIIPFQTFFKLFLSCIRVRKLNSNVTKLNEKNI